MPDTLLLRAGLLAALLCPLAGATLGLGCKPRPPECPSGPWCGSSAQADGLRQTPEEALSCPRYVGWVEDAGAPPAAELPSRAEASFDGDLTRKRRAAGGTDVCCYRWYTSCPGAKR